MYEEDTSVIQLRILLRIKIIHPIWIRKHFKIESMHGRRINKWVAVVRSWWVCIMTWRDLFVVHEHRIRIILLFDEEVSHANHHLTCCFLFSTSPSLLPSGSILDSKCCYWNCSSTIGFTWCGRKSQVDYTGIKRKSFAHLLFTLMERRSFVRSCRYHLDWFGEIVGRDATMCALFG